jgi:hypothetical protein
MQFKEERESDNWRNKLKEKAYLPTQQTEIVMACWNEVKQCDPEETQYVKLQETQLTYTLHRFILDGMTGEISTSPVAVSKPRRRVYSRKSRGF